MLNKNESTLNAYFAVMVSINLTLAHYAEETRENSLFKQADANLRIIPFLLLGGKGHKTEINSETFCRKTFLLMKTLRASTETLCKIPHKVK